MELFLPPLTVIVSRNRAPRSPSPVVSRNRAIFPTDHHSLHRLNNRLNTTTAISCHLHFRRPRIFKLIVSRNRAPRSPSPVVSRNRAIFPTANHQTRCGRRRQTPPQAPAASSSSTRCFLFKTSVATETPKLNLSTFKYTTLHVVGELVALIDAIGADKVFVVGHDWGAAIAWRLCLFRPDKVKALVNLSVHYAPRNHLPLTVETYRVHCGNRLVEPRETEVKLSLLGIKKVLETYLAHRGPSPFNFPNFITFFATVPGFDDPRVVVLPSWLSEEDVDYYAKKFKKTGFRQAMNYVYRYLDLTWELEAPWLEAKVNVPAKFIVGESDWAYHKPGVKQYIESGEFKKNVPMLEEVVVIQGAAHFINQEVPDKINTHIYDFFQKFKDA